MPLFFQQNISAYTKLCIWKIEEPETFFLEKAILLQPVAHPHKRLQHLAGRYLLQYLFPDIALTDIHITNTRKPVLLNGQYYFSISHSREYAAAIVSSRQQAGIDIEMYSSKIGIVQHKFLSDAERIVVNNIVNQNPWLQTGNQIIVTLCWCAKEAVYKWWGSGGIDFKKHITINSINLAEQRINITFKKEIQTIDLVVHYNLFDSFCSAWLVE